LIVTVAAELLPARQASAAANLVRMMASGSTTGGRNISIRVVISEPAPAGGIDIPLRSSSSAIRVPSSVHVDSGQTEKLISVRTVPVINTVDVTVTASYKGVTRQRTVTIKEPFHSSLSVQSVIRAGSQGRVTVRLSGRAPAGGITIALSTKNQDVFKLPASITIPAGAYSGAARVDATDQPGDVSISVTSHYQKGAISNTHTKNAIVRHFDTATVTPTDTPTHTPTSTNTPGPTATFTPTATSTPDPSDPTLTFTILSPAPDGNGKYTVASGGTAVVQVCMTVAPAGPYKINFITSSSLRALVTDPAPDAAYKGYSWATFTNVGDCVNVTMTDQVYELSGNVRLIARIEGRSIPGASSAFITFAGEPPTVTATVSTETAEATSTPAPTETATDVPTATDTPVVTNTPVPTTEAP
jgi:hypothetical protein